MAKSRTAAAADAAAKTEAAAEAADRSWLSEQVAEEEKADAAEAAEMVAEDDEARALYAEREKERLAAEAAALPVRAAVPMTGKPGEGLLREACHAFGIDPDPDVRPREVAEWKHYPATPDAPEHVVIVTGGGQKLAWPMDEPTIERLRLIFRVDRVNEKGERVSGALPADLALPLPMITGFPQAGGQHVYRRGYLREGGKTEAARRESTDKNRRR